MQAVVQHQQVNSRFASEAAGFMRILVHDYAGHPFQTSLSRELARRGHEVVHAFFGGDKGPKGNFRRRADDAGKLRFEALFSDSDYDKGSLIRRRFADIQYGKIVADLIDAEKPDLVISGNTPTEAQSYVVNACKRNSSAFVYWVQDFYSIAATKILTKKLGVLGQFVGQYYRSLERRQMKTSDAIVTITSDFENLARDWGGDKVTTIENWGLLDEISPTDKVNPWSLKNRVSSTFNFVYSGTLGMKHNPTSLCELARAVQGRANVIVVGEGTGMATLRKFKETEGLDNLSIHPLAPFEELKYVLGSADVAVALIEPDAGSFSVPSKVQSYMCAGRAVLLAAPADNLASKVVRRENAGLVVDPDDSAGFLACAEQMLSKPAARLEFGENGRRYADRTFDVSRVTDRFVNVFTNALERRTGRVVPKHQFEGVL